jgi:hypothetical protein
MDVYMETNLTDRVVARVPAPVDASAEAADAWRGETQATLYADLRKIHFFEPGETGMNLSLSQGYSKELSHALA